MKKREYSKRHIQILALQRCSRAISLATKNNLFVPEDFPTHHAEYPYRVELDNACNEIAYQLRKRLAKLARKEWPRIENEIFLEEGIRITNVQHYGGSEGEERSDR